MTFPKISIITPNYNGAQYLETTILSVLNQKYPNLEYIIIDGGSKDNSIEIIKKYESQLYYWTSEPDGGMYEAIQKGFDKSTGEIMGWINSDDVIYGKALFSISNIFHFNPRVDWIEGLNSIIDDTGRINMVVSPPPRYKFRYLSKFMHPLPAFGYQQQESTFWRKSLWNKAGKSLNTNLKLAGDFDLWMRFFDYAELYQVNTVLGAFRVSGKAQLSINNIGGYEKEVTQSINASLDRLSVADKRKFRHHVLVLKVLNRIPKYGGYLKEWYLNQYYKNKKIMYDSNLLHFKPV